MYAYFDASMTLDEAKAHYKKLVRQHHPDAGGDTRTMQDINAEWAKFQAAYSKHGERQRQEKAHTEGRKTSADFHDLDEVFKNIAEKLEAALNLNMPEDVTIELCGMWIWITGNTKPHAKKLGKDGIGFKFAGDKKAWFYAGIPSTNRQRRTMEEIRDMHGTRVFNRHEWTDHTTEADEPTNATVNAGVLHA